MTWLALASEWYRDHARTENTDAFVEVLKDFEPGIGIAFLWEQQLLKTPVESLESSGF
ncbi:hypothetical protein D3C71_1972260 [compost metagenome]